MQGQLNRDGKLEASQWLKKAVWTDSIRSLGRDSHALLWMLTLGGFGFGWAREAIRIPAYVGEANQDAEKDRKKPPLVPPLVGPVRFVGQPGCQCHCCTEPQGQTSTDTWENTETRLGLAWLAFSAPLGYCIFYNTTATLYYLSDCVSALLDMFWFLPWLRNVFEYILLIPYRLLCVLTGGGYYEDAWRKVLEILLKEYTKKEKDALKVFSLDEEASMEDITRSYRGLAKIWHPDRNPSSKEAEVMFMKIHEAYEVLRQWHKPRRFTA
ncbi:DnaJ subfamily C member 22 [Liparis tanakae]|uniref:DnaJ subfamily C member 22 n=1 Tax=Liparis tanakae TaxID=230148 RepID=A0A4Z2IX65_9TELE|nr:DnaJ subfamily C member 22 [Liparis tanakae]